MNILLLSLGLGRVPDFLGDSIRRIGFVPTAGDPYDDPSFVDDDRRELTAMGFELADIDVANISARTLASRLTMIDAVFVAGGNTFYLMSCLRKNSLESSLVGAVKSGLAYVGTSAGAAIAGPTIEPFESLDDPAMAPDFADRTGLGLVPFVVLPHYGKPKYEDRYQSTIRRYSPKYDLRTLRDHEGLELKGASDEWVGVSSPITSLATNRM